MIITYLLIILYILLNKQVPEERLIVQYKRNDYFSKVLPQVDHLAFISNEISIVKNILINVNIIKFYLKYYKINLKTIIYL